MKVVELAEHLVEFIRILSGELVGIGVGVDASVVKCRPEILDVLGILKNCKVVCRARNFGVAGLEGTNDGGEWDFPPLHWPIGLNLELAGNGF